MRNRGSSALAILCLGLGIGLQTTMFASGDPWLFRPLPYARPEGLAAVREIDPQGSAHHASTNCGRSIRYATPLPTTTSVMAR